METSRWVEAQVYSGELTSDIVAHSEAMQTLARARPLSFHAKRLEGTPSKNEIVSVLTETEVVIPMASMVNTEAEKERLQKEIEQNRAEVARLDARLNDKAFLNKAPAAVVDRERDRLEERKDKLERLKQQLDRFR